MRKLAALVVALSLAMGVSLVQAQEVAMPAAMMDKTQSMPNTIPCHKKAPRMGHHGMFEGLNLTEMQREKMRTIAQAFRQQHPSSPMMNEHHKEMQSIITADTFDEKAAKSKIEKYSKQRDMMVLARMKMENSMYNVLTLEQKKEANQRYEKKSRKMSQYHEKMLQSDVEDNTEMGN